jgi:hypothetical protein
MGKDLFFLSKKMVSAGVEVYQSPGRYESPEQIVERIFWAMLSSSSSSSSSVSPKLGSEEIVDVEVIHRRRGPGEE